MSEIIPQTVLSLTGPGYGLSLKLEAIELKKSLLALSAPILSVTSTEDLDAARVVVKELAAFRVQLEKSRKAVKEPVIELGRKIDEAAEKFGEDCAREEKRITVLGQAYAAEQERKRRDAAERERKAAEEAARAAAEEARRIEAIAAAERARIAAEAQQVETRQADLARQDQAAAAERLAAEQAMARAEAQAKLALEATRFVAPAVAGTKAVLDYEIEDIHALYEQMPGLVELSPRRREILAMLERVSAYEEVPVIAGLKVVQKLKLK